MNMMSSQELNRWIGSQIYRARAIRKLSQETLAEAADVSRVFISQLENGNGAAKIYTYYRVACALDISLYELFLGNGNNGLLEGILSVLSDCSADEIHAYTNLIRIIKNHFVPIEK